MKFKTGLQLSAIFTPLLALLVGLALFLKSQYVDEVGARLRLLDVTAEDVFDLNIVGQQYVARHDPSIRQEWQHRHAALTTRLNAEKIEAPAEKMVFEQIKRTLERLSDAFAQLVVLYESPPARSATPAATTEKAARLAGELLRYSQTIMSDTLKLAALSHYNALTTQQYADALIIIVSAAVALLLAGLAYLTIKSELAHRKQMARDLERSHILLSDAFVKLRRAEIGVEVERASGLEEMVQSIANEIHAQLQPILRTSETLLNYPENLHDEGKAQHSLQTIRQAAQALNGVLNRLKQIFRSEHAIVPRSVNVAQVVNDALQYVQPKLAAARQKGAAVEVATQLSELPPIDGAEAELREALVNVVLNALEAMPRGGKLTIIVQAETDHLVCRLTDTGRGMSEEVLRHCCDPFFSTREEGAEGMGLTIAATAVRRHQGTLEIDSQPGTGTTVTFRLPVRIELGTAEPKAPVAPPVARRLRVLIVDDQLWVAQVISDLLAQDGHTVEAVASGREGVAKFRNTPFDLVITDRAMPDMDGEQVAAAVKRAAPRTPVILLTGFGNIIKDAGLSSATVDVVLSKPVTADRLRRAVADAVAKMSA